MEGRGGDGPLSEIDPDDPARPTRDVNAGESFADLMFGARYTRHLGGNRGVTLRGDGSWGSIEGTWSAMASSSPARTRLTWRFTGRRSASRSRCSGIAVIAPCGANT